MELNGKVSKVLPIESGEGKNGTWQKQSIIIETDNGKYPKKVAVAFWGDLVDNSAFVEGNNISVEFDVESREYNGKWYTDVKAWRINSSNTSSSTSYTNNKDSQKKTNELPVYTTNENIPEQIIDDDLPF